MRNKQNLGQKWKNFLNIILSPGSIIFLLIALFSLFMSISRPESEKLLSDVFAVFASISTAGAGIFIKDDWEKMRGKSLVEEKGRSAIRNLESIGRQILQIRNWIKVFVSQKKNEKRDLEEINRHLSVTERNIVSGIAESFSAEEVVGKKVTVLVNLSPRELRGVESQGMILMTETPEGKLVFVNPDNSKAANGLSIS